MTKFRLRTMLWIMLGRKASGILRYSVIICLLSSLLISCIQEEPGTVKGEFHDASLLEESFKTDPEKSSWNDRELWEGGTGATLQAKTFGHPVGPAEIYHDGKIIAAADGWGQFRIDLSPGTYTLTGVCPGYEDRTLSVTVESGKTNYINFILNPEPDE